MVAKGAALEVVTLSQHAFIPEILRPQALANADVLTPHFNDPRVFSPEALIITVLSPDFLPPRIASPEATGGIILSLNVLSPRVASEEKLLVEVLSPHILGGAHMREEASYEVVQIGSHSDDGESDELESATAHLLNEDKLDPLKCINDG